ncbi:MAG: serine/threonine-protein kinase [bacterium]|nr:serine/threonine-protein kinase [bacterium]
MSDIVYVDGKPVQLKEMLGQGAMASVYRCDVQGKPKAAKIFVYDGDPDKETMREVRAQKIPRMVTMNLPKEILPPEKVITDRQDVFQGFIMELMPKGYGALAELYSPQFWARQLITPSRALKVLKGLNALKNLIHVAGLVICDFNPGNAMFHFSQFGKVLGCDADSYQVPGFNGREIHFAYGAPRLYNRDLAAGLVPFLPEDDEWSLRIHYITGITRGGHPFRAAGQWFKKATTGMDIPERVLAGLSRFHPKAETIGNALPIEILPDEALQLLEQELVQMKRAEKSLPDWMFELKFQECPHCHNEFARAKCPFCQKQVFMPQPVGVFAVQYTPDIFKTRYPIVATAIVARQVLMVVREGKRFRLSVLSESGKVEKENFLQFEIQSGADYSVAIGKELVVVADSESVQIFNHSGEKIETTTTNNFLGKPSFGVGEFFHRCVGAQVMRWQSIVGNWVYKPVVQGMPIGATWLGECLAGLVIMAYASGVYEWSVLQGFARKKIAVQGIPRGYFQQRQHVAAFDKSELVVFRVLENTRGKQVTLVDRFEVLTDVVQSAQFSGVINQAAYLKGTILFSADDGLMIWKKGGDPVVREGTVDAVSEGDAIQLIDGSTIVVVKGNTLGLLTTKKK